MTSTNKKAAPRQATASNTNDQKSTTAPALGSSLTPQGWRKATEGEANAQIMATIGEGGAGR